MVPIDATLDSLATSARRLNRETDSFNDLIAGLDERLDEMNVGVTVWDHGLGGALFDGGWLLDETVHSACTLAGDSTGESTGWVIGYTKFSDGWGLAAKEVTVTTGFDDGDTECPYENVVTDGVTVSLLRAPRIVRVEAAGRLESLLEQLRERVDQFSNGIEKAKKLAAGD